MSARRKKPPPSTTNPTLKCFLYNRFNPAKQMHSVLSTFEWKRPLPIITIYTHFPLGFA